MIPTEQYRYIADSVPILCVDLVLTNHEGEYLLVERTNEPLKGRWWVPGGRVLKGETLAEAASRKLQQELGVSIPLQGPVGCCEYLLDESPFDLHSGHHAVALIFTGVGVFKDITLDYQGSRWGFFPSLPDDFKMQAFDLPFHRERVRASTKG